MMIFNSRNRFFLIFSIAALSGLAACHEGSHQKDPEVSSPASDSSIAKAVIKYAHGFRIDYFNGYKEVKILNRTGDRTDTLDYLLIPQGTKPPADHPGAQVITTPVKSLVVMSSMHIAQLDFAGAADRITGLGNGEYVISPLVREGLRTGKIRQVGADANINNEMVITMHPDVLMTMSNPDATFGQFKTLI